MTASIAGRFDEFDNHFSSSLSDAHHDRVQVIDARSNRDAGSAGVNCGEGSAVTDNNSSAAMMEIPAAGGNGRQSDQNKHSKWILNPAIDYMLACGGLAWLLFGLHYFVLSGTGHGPAAAALLTLSSLGALILGEGHTAATLVHTYRRADLRTRFTLYTKWLPAFFLALAACGTVIPGVAPVLVKIYLLLVPHHFMAQSYGIARVYCVKHGYALADEERKVLQLVTLSTTAFAIIRQLTGNELHDKPFFGQMVPAWQILPHSLYLVSQVVLVSCIITFLALITVRALKEKKMFPLPALLTMATGIGGFTMIPSATGIYWLYVSAFFHGTQYFLTVLSSHWNEYNVSSCKERLRTLTCNSPTTRMLAMIALVSVFIYIGIPRILESFGLSYTLAMAAIFTTMNMHHTAIDGVLWKLRRSDVRNAVS